MLAVQLEIRKKGGHCKFVPFAQLYIHEKFRISKQGNGFVEVRFAIRNSNENYFVNDTNNKNKIFIGLHCFFPVVIALVLQRDLLFGHHHHR